MEPRSFTRNSLSNILEFDFGKESTANEHIWLALLHISSTICFVFFPLLLWSWKKEESYKIDQQGRHVINFQITIMLILFSFALLLMIAPMVWMMLNGMDQDTGMLGNLFTLLPPLPILLLALFTSYQAVVNTVRALSDKPVRYPLSIPFVR